MSEAGEIPKILVVDDETAMLDLAVHLLEQAGYRTITASGGEAAFCRARQEHPDLVLLDVMLPDVDGIEVCRRLKADPETQGALVVMYSGQRIDPDEQSAGLEAGADGYLAKTISNREFLARVRAYLRIKQAEDARRESEKRYRSLFDHVPVGLYRVTPEGKVLDANPALVDLLGYPDLGTLLATNAEETYVDPEDRRKWRALIEAGEIVQGYELRLRRYDGTLVWARMNTRAILDEAGQALYYEGSLEDVSGQRSTEHALRESETRYRNLVATMNEGLGMRDKDGMCTYVNRRFCEMLGYTADEIVGCNFSKFIDPTSYENYMEQLNRQRGGGQSSYEQVWIAKDGRKIASIVSPKPLFDDQGGFVGSFAIITDISERKRMETALKEYSEKLEEMVASRTRELQETQEQLLRHEKLTALGQMAGSVAHELRNPLSAIGNGVYFLNMALEDTRPEIQDALRIINDEVRRADAIIRGLLDFARTKSPVWSVSNLNDILRKTLSRMEVAENIVVVCKFEDGLPPVLCDPDQLDQVFGNLILNAVQSMETGGRLEVESEMDTTDWVRVSISDTGTGIAEGNRDRVFEPLFTTKAKGFGLGLALVKALVDGHGGRIEVESEEGKGSTFTVKLPVWVKEMEDGR
jgi:PAS domain S-box-containing protein